MQSLLSLHGAKKLAGQEELSNTKAKIIYDVLDSNSEIYQVVPQQHARSRMNICFRIRGGDETSEKIFLKGAEERLLQGLKGHRSVQGIRASNYNAISMADVERLAAYLLEFAKAGMTADA
jgi:phosphoserine aminotransferase